MIAYCTYYYKDVLTEADCYHCSVNVTEICPHFEKSNHHILNDAELEEFSVKIHCDSNYRKEVDKNTLLFYTRKVLYLLHKAETQIKKLKGSV